MLRSLIALIFDRYLKLLASFSGSVREDVTSTSQDVWEDVTDCGLGCLSSRTGGLVAGKVTVLVPF